MPQISGVTKDALGVPVSAVVDVHRSDKGVLVARTVSDPVSGAFMVETADTAPHVVTRHVAPVIEGDANWANVALALRMNGADNSTTFTDEKNHVFTASGAKISTAQSLFNGSSGYFDGASHLAAAVGSDLDCGTAPFTVRGKIRYGGTGNGQPLIVGNNNGWSAGGCSINVDNAWAPNKLSVTAHSYSSVAVILASTSDVPIDTWCDFEIGRSETSLYLMLNGFLEATATIAADLTFNWGLGGLRIGGGNWDGSGSFFAGYIQEIELFNGVVVNTTTFTPSTAPFLGAPTPGTPTANAQVFDNVIPGTPTIPEA